MERCWHSAELGLVLIEWQLFLKPVWILRTPFVRFLETVIIKIVELFVGYSWITLFFHPLLLPLSSSPAFFQLPTTSLHLCLLSCFRCKFFSLTETPENYTVVLDEEGFKGKTPLCIHIFDNFPQAGVCPPTLSLLLSQLSTIKQHLKLYTIYWLNKRNECASA